ncbi:MAG: DUF4838 domain-containing protein [Clostridia bacterium]|nr:DUF4838 domain-containing protein [Clostridia bacterium]
MKKIVAALLCVMMIFSTVVSVAALRENGHGYNIIVEDTFKLGDANDDGLANAIDALEIKKYCASIGSVNENGSDINCDGAVNAKDLLVLKKCHAGVEDLSGYDDEDAVDSFTIAGVDISEFTLVYPENAKYVENCYYAASTFNRLLRKTYGFYLDIAPSDEGVEHKIEFVDVTTVPGLEEELEIENYKYEVVDGDLYIYGTRRGSMYAVYEILEEYLGIRFYSDQFTYQYTDRYSDIPEGTSVFHDSYLEFRICCQSFWHNDQAHYFPNRLNGSQHGDSSKDLGTLTGPHFINAHSFGYYWKMATGRVFVDYKDNNKSDYAAKYNVGEEKDEYSWNPCSTNDGVYATLFRGMLETMRYIQDWHTFREDTSAMSFSICDNRSLCTCNSCKYIMSSGTDRRLGKRLECGEAGLNLYIANRACDDIVAYYEGRSAESDEYGSGEGEHWGYGQGITDAYPYMRVYTILYGHDLPHESLMTDERYDGVRPRDNLIIMYCGNPCNNHYMGAYECNGVKNILGDQGEDDAESLVAWGNIAKQTGTDVWFWYYPVNYNTYMSDSPNIFNIWYDFKFIVEECNVSGIYYEGASKGYVFENLKAHLAAVMMWSMVENADGSVSMMSYDEFLAEMKAWMKAYYGPGYEYLYEYICMQDEAGNVNDVRYETEPGSGELAVDENGEYLWRNICYINNCDYPGDMFDYEYTRDNYECMRELVTKAIDMTENDKQLERCMFILMNCEFMGLSAVRQSWYLSEDATEEHKALYEERYTWLFHFMRDYEIKDPYQYNSNGTDRIIVNANLPENYMDTVPFDFTISPIGLTAGSFEDDGTFDPGGETWRKYSTGWEWTGSVPVWGYYG